MPIRYKHGNYERNWYEWLLSQDDKIGDTHFPERFTQEIADKKRAAAQWRVDEHRMRELE